MNCFILFILCPDTQSPGLKESQALFLSGEVSEVLDLAGHVSIMQGRGTGSRQFLSLQVFSVPCQHAEDQSGK